MHHLRRTGVCLMVFLTTGSGIARPASPDAYSIFDRARSYWDAASYPSSVSYDIVVSVSHNSVSSTAHYHAYYDTTANKIVPQPVSDEERAHPYVPHGINTKINLFGGSIPLSAPQHSFDYLGVPVLSPNYSFGIATLAPHVAQPDSADLVREIRHEFNDPEPPHRSPAQQKGLKTIVSVEATHRHYVISLAGIVSLAGHDDYHLTLRPVSDPSVYRLRELWINTNTFATNQLVTEGNFTAPQLAGVKWFVTFKQIARAPYLQSESAQSGFTLDRRRYDTAKIEFTKIQPSRLPPYATLSTFETNSETAPEVLSEPEQPI